jgi:hypothetical protein
MRKLIYLLPFVVFTACGGSDKPVEPAEVSPLATPVAIGKQTAAFSESLLTLLTSYYAVKDALIEADTTLANKAAQNLLVAADSLKLSEVKGDTAIVATLNTFRGNIASESRGFLGETNITEKRRAFSMITENLYPFLQAIKYDGQTVYHQLCPMAFNDDEEASWLSNSREVVNPYLGKKHPKYASGMLHCGEVKDSLGAAH